MYVLLWQYRVRPGSEEHFLEHYGPSGSWARLFGRSEGYLGTDLLRDSERASDFVTVDRWESEAHQQAFLRAFKAEYAALDTECEALTESERLIGRYHSAEPPVGEPFTNVYGDDTRALAYAGLEFPGTYYLAFRDIPGLLCAHTAGGRALDFGCGTGRSSRFLKEQGFEVVGVDISDAMLAHARARDSEGTYRLVPDGDLTSLEPGTFDLVFSAFTFDNVPGREARAGLFQQIAGLLSPGGRMVNLVSAPEIYRHEWTSFSTRDFAENQIAQGGDRVRIVMLDVEDRRPVEDVLWTEADYRALYEAAGLQVIELHRPLGTADDPFEWVSETETSPWAIYVLGRAD